MPPFTWTLPSTTVTVNAVTLNDDELCRKLLTVLRLAAHVPTLEFDGEPVRLHGGFWADLFAFRLRGAPADWTQELVARVMPEAGTARKETAIQQAVISQRARGVKQAQLSRGL